MKKLSLITFLTIGMLVAGLMQVQAVTLDTVDFDHTTYNGRTCTKVSDITAALQPYFHTFTLPIGSILTDAALTITHYGNTNNNAELWLVNAGGLLDTIRVGQLGTSSSGWVDQVLNLNTDVLSRMNSIDLWNGTALWNLEVKLCETTEDSIWRPDTVYLDKSVLSGTVNTSPVPEPASMLLFGSGFMGLLGFGYRKMRA
jgi:hypothetical protein